MHRISRGTAFCLASLALFACGDRETPDVQENSVVERADTGPATISFAQDGDTIRARVGETFSVKMALPGVTKTGIEWGRIEGDFQDVAELTRTYRTLEGDLVYSDLIFRAAAAGQATATFAPMSSNLPVSDERLSLTFIIEP